MALPDNNTMLALYESRELPSARAFARRFGVSPEWAAQKLNRALVEAGKEPLNPRGKKPIPPFDTLFKLVHVDHIPLANREAYGASAATVMKWLDHHGIEHPKIWTTRRANTAN